MARRIYTYETEVWVPKPPAEVFAYFADAHNLVTITPPWLHFRVVTPSPIHMAAGALIDYRLRVHGLPLRWRTRIAAWDPPHRFVDEQIKGPYHLWLHEHVFEPSQGGTMCKDHVDYSVPLGRWVHRLFVRHDIERIFAYRRGKLIEAFGHGK